MEKKRQKSLIKTLKRIHDEIEESGRTFKTNQVFEEGYNEVKATKAIQEAIEYMEKAHNTERLWEEN